MPAIRALVNSSEPGIKAQGHGLGIDPALTHRALWKRSYSADGLVCHAASAAGFGETIAAGSQCVFL